MKIYGYNGQKNICGDRLRQLRLMRRLSQAALAAKMQTKGVPMEQDIISRIESGERLVTYYEAYAFAKLLGVSLDELIVPSGQED